MLTDTALKNYRHSPRLKKLFDGNGSGLHVLCHPGGKKTFAMKYPHPSTGKEQTLTIGEYPVIGLKDARTEVANARALLANGIDPRDHKVRAKAEVKAATQDTFENLALEWIKVRGARWSDSYRNKIVVMLTRHLFPSIGSMAITQVTAPLLLSVLRPIESSGKTDLTHTLMQQASAIFRFAMATSRALADPAAALRGALAPHKQENFPAVTSPKEFAELLIAMDAYQGEYVTRSALAFTVLTFQRSQSIRYAQWAQIDWNAKTWRIPAEIMKMKEAHLVPLSDQAISLLKLIEPLTGNSEYIFPSLFGRQKALSENTMLYALVRLGYRGRMTVHGFRTAASTLLNENGHHPDVIEAALAHTRGDIRSIYNKAKYLPERIKMYQWWADYCDELRQHRQAEDEAQTTISQVMGQVQEASQTSANARFLPCTAYQ